MHVKSVNVSEVSRIKESSELTLGLIKIVEDKTEDLTNIEERVKLAKKHGFIDEVLYDYFMYQYSGAENFEKLLRAKDAKKASKKK